MYCFNSYIDDNKNAFIEKLSQAVSIKSISSDPKLRNEVIKMMKWALVKLQAFGADVELCDIGSQVYLINIFVHFTLI